MYNIASFISPCSLSCNIPVIFLCTARDPDLPRCKEYTTDNFILYGKMPMLTTGNIISQLISRLLYNFQLLFPFTSLVLTRAHG